MVQLARESFELGIKACCCLNSTDGKRSFSIEGVM